MICKKKGIPQSDRFLNRRRFLKWSGGCGAMSTLSGLSGLLSLNLTNSAMAAVGSINDYKAMVCIQLAGGY